MWGDGFVQRRQNSSVSTVAVLFRPVSPVDPFIYCMYLFYTKAGSCLRSIDLRLRENFGLTGVHDRDRKWKNLSLS